MKLNKKKVSKDLAKFIWDFKVGDNIVYNFKILFFLYGRRKRSLNKKLFNKIISIEIVSILEGIFYDLMCRLDKSTGHFPDSIDHSFKEKIKNQINSEKKWFTYELITGETRRIKRIKNYSMSELIKFLESYNLLGDDYDIYKKLINASYLRNRIHIFNWFNNFESTEDVAFSDKRLMILEKLLDDIMTIMIEKYKRPFNSRQEQFWYRKMKL